MYKHILVPTDGSPLSLKAVKTAAKLAKTCKARVTAIHVMPPFIPPMASEGVVFRAANLVTEYEKGTRRSAEKVLAKVAGAIDAPCDTVAVFDPRPWEAIVKAAGKAGPEVGGQRFPRFETYREHIDGKYWFPTYTYADDILAFDSGDVHIRMVVKYTDYKEFSGSITVVGEDEP